MGADGSAGSLPAMSVGFRREKAFAMLKTQIKAGAFAGGKIRYTLSCEIIYAFSRRSVRSLQAGMLALQSNRSSLIAPVLALHAESENNFPKSVV